jgi:hypothetical protein
LDVHTKPGKADLLEEGLYNLRGLVKSVRERLRGRNAGVAEAWVVGRDDVKALAECRDAVPVLVRGSGKAVQQQQLRAARLSALAIEDVQSVDFGCLR